MDNIVTLETAKALKEAGFPQPEPKEGQIWYGLIQRQEQPLFIIFDGDFFVDRYGNCCGKEAFENWGTFAPTATDILERLGGAYSLICDAKYWFCRNESIKKTYSNFSSRNPAEVVALAFLESVKIETVNNMPPLPLEALDYTQNNDHKGFKTED